MPDLADDPAYRELLAQLSSHLIETGARKVLIAGAQGSGKSTLSKLLASRLKDAHGKRTAVLSIDDFYLTRAKRLALAAEVHANLAVRGVPGTHDVALMNEVIDTLLRGEQAAVPRFNKAEDDRYPDTERVGPVDLVILEGWCVGVTAEEDDALLAPVNDLERTSDPDLAWRKFVNAQLQGDGYKTAFSGDCLVFLAVPDFEAVYRWRLQQEAGLPEGSQVMSAGEVRTFIQYYERLTRHMLRRLPERADWLVQLESDHSVGTIVRQA